MALSKREYTNEETVITAENLNDIQDAIIALEDGLFSIDNNKSGEIIAITDAAKRGFRSLTIYGKTTQDGTPTPEAPVELVSVGANGDIGVNVCGLQLANTAESLINHDIISITAQGKRVEVKSKTAYVNAQFALSLSPNTDYVLSYTTNLVSGQYNAKIIGIDYNGVETSIVVSVEKPLVFNSGKYSSWKVAFYSTTELSTNPVFESIMVNIGTSALPWEPYNGQTLTVLTPNGLPGIPATSGGNYTDANGQQWVCDEKDFARGVYVQRIALVSKPIREYRLQATTSQNGLFQVLDFEAKSLSPIMSNMFIDGDTRTVNYTISTNRGGNAFPHFNYSEYTTVDELKSAKGDNTLTIVYVLATPIETPLSEEELVAYAALHTYRDNTTVSNDAGAYMDLEYVMDAKKYIDSLIITGGSSARIANVTLLASAWKTEADGLHSQVVSVAGVTEYSKVDLLPSVEQLAIFHNKDVAFVTENEDGVVTVFAIGDKPLLDYTMQAQITEVVV